MKNHCREEGSLFPRKGESGILSDQPLEEPAFRAAVEGPGHQVLVVKRALYQKKAFFLFGKGGKGAAVPEHTVQGGGRCWKKFGLSNIKKGDLFSGGEGASLCFAYVFSGCRENHVGAVNIQCLYGLQDPSHKDGGSNAFR